MSYAGLDLSRKRLDVHVLDEDGQTVEVTAVHHRATAMSEGRSRRTVPSACAGRSSRTPTTRLVTLATGSATSGTRIGFGRQRGAKVARVDIARKLAEAIWHILTKNEPFAPAGPATRLVA